MPSRQPRNESEVHPELDDIDQRKQGYCEHPDSLAVHIPEHSKHSESHREHHDQRKGEEPHNLHLNLHKPSRPSPDRQLDDEVELRLQRRRGSNAYCPLTTSDLHSLWGVAEQLVG